MERRIHIFVAYTLNDGLVDKNLLIKVKEWLADQGTSFIDLLDNDSEHKQERILNELQIADKLFLINTPLAQNSHWVKIELEAAKSRNIPIIYILPEQF